MPGWPLPYPRLRSRSSRDREPKKVFFLHLPKCAGTSVWAVLRQLAGKDRTLQVYSAERAREFAEMDPTKRDSFRAIGGHFALESYRSRLDLTQYFSITTFRDPVERLVSEYYYTRANPKHSEHRIVSKLSLRDFIELDPNPITRLICGRADAKAAAGIVSEVFHCWAFVDELPSLIATVCSHFNKPIPRLPHINAGPLSLNAILIDEEHRALIAERHAADVEFHQILRNEWRDGATSVPQAAKGVAARPAANSSPGAVFNIVTPTYNMGQYLDETIRSVVGQEGDFQIRYHIQDGGSQDRTMEIARDWRERIESGGFKVRCQDVRLTVSSGPDGGMYDAISVGFRYLAPGPDDFATWINGDDKIASGALATVADAFRDMPTAELVGGRNATISAEGEPLVSGYLPLYPRRLVAAGLHDGRRLPCIMQEGTFWRASLWQRAGGVDPSFRLAGDWDLWVRFAAQADYVTLDAVTGYHRRRPGQKTETLRAYHREIDERLKVGAEEREQVLREYEKARRPDSSVSAEFRARIARRDELGHWILSDDQVPAPKPRELKPVDGDWTVVSGFDEVGPFPDQRVKRPFHWSVERPAILQVFSARAGARTLSLRLGCMAPGQRIRVRVDGGPTSEHKLRRRFPKSSRLDFRRYFEAGPSTVDIDVSPSVAATHGKPVGVALFDVGFWRGGSQMAWFRRMVPKPLRPYVLR